MRDLVSEKGVESELSVGKDRLAGRAIGRTPWRLRMSESGGVPKAAAKKKRRPRATTASTDRGSATSADGGPSAALAASRLVGDGPPPDAAQIGALQPGLGNGVMADVMDTPRSKASSDAAAAASPAPVPVAVPAAPAPVTVAADDQAVAVAAPVAGPVLGAATALEAASDLADAWKTTDQLATKLFAMTRSLLDDTMQAATKKKHRQQLAAERTKIDAAEPPLSAAIVAGFRETSLCEMDLRQGLMGAADGIAALQAAHQEILTTLIRGLMDAAKLARTQGDTGRAAVFINDARQAEQAGGELPGGGGAAKTPTPHHDRLATVNTYADTANNLGPGLAGGIIGGVEAGRETIGGLSNASATISGASGVFGGVFAGLGVVFGSIGMALGIRASVRGSSKQAKLENLHATLESDKLSKATAFAANKKRKKKEGGKATAIAGGLAVTAGVVGLIAISVATLGVGAAILGVGAALIGLGFIIGKWIHKHRKRKRYAETIAHALVDAANDDGDAAASQDAIAQLQARGFDTSTLGTPEESGQIAALVEVLRDEGRNRRDDTARTIYEAMVGRDVSEQVDAERIVETLGLSPEQLRSYPEGKARDLIARKMQSW